jgi:hypothetical protein
MLATSQIHFKLSCGKVNDPNQSFAWFEIDPGFAGLGNFNNIFIN